MSSPNGSGLEGFHCSIVKNQNVKSGKNIHNVSTSITNDRLQNCTIWECDVWWTHLSLLKKEVKSDNPGSLS